MFAAASNGYISKIILLQFVEMEDFNGNIINGITVKKLIFQDLEFQDLKINNTWLYECNILCIDINIHKITINSTKTDNNINSKPDEIIIPYIPIPIKANISINKLNIEDKASIENIYINNLDLYNNSLSINSILFSVNNTYNNIYKFNIDNDENINISMDTNIESNDIEIINTIISGKFPLLNINIASKGNLQIYTNTKLDFTNLDTKINSDIEMFMYKKLIEANINISGNIKQLNLTADINLNNNKILLDTKINDLQEANLTATIFQNNTKFEINGILNNKIMHMFALGELYIDELFGESVLNDLALTNIDIAVNTDDYKDYKITLYSDGKFLNENIHLEGKIDTDLNIINIDNLDIFNEKGKLNTRAFINLHTNKDNIQDFVDFSIINSFNNFNIGNFIAYEYLQTKLTGSIIANGNIHKNDITKSTINIAHHLDGTINYQDSKIDAHIVGNIDRWDITNLQAKIGKNTFKAKGSLNNNTLNLNTDINIINLEQLHKKLSGKVQGKINIINNDFDISATANNIKYTDIQIEKLKILAHTKHNDIQADILINAKQYLDKLSISLNGSLNKHKLYIEANRQNNIIKINSLGNFTNNSNHKYWQNINIDNYMSTIVSLDMYIYNTNWKLQKSFNIIKDLQNIYATNHCFTNNHASLCSNKEIHIMPSQNIDYTLKNFDISKAINYKDTHIKGLLNTKLSITMIEEHQNITIDSSLNNIDIISNKEHILKSAHLNLHATVQDGKLKAVVNIADKAQGSVLVDTNIDIQTQNIDGVIKINGLNLRNIEAVSAISPAIDGSVQGNINIQGTLLDILLYGNMSIANVKYVDQSIPIELDKTNLNISFHGKNAVINGNFNANKGSGTINGTISLREQLGVNLNVKGNNINANIKPYANLTISPDIVVNFINGFIDVHGKLDIPKGSITIAKAPVNAINLSSDAKIVGTQKVQAPNNFKMNLKVNIGEPYLSFYGFGVESVMHGSVNIKEDMIAQGELVIPYGIFESYGQKLAIRTSKIVFIDTLMNPLLNIQAVKEANDGTIAGVNVTGRSNRTQARIFSEPSMDQTQALSYLILGKPLDSASTSENSYIGQAALAIGLATGEKIGETMGEALGLKKIQISTEPYSQGYDITVTTSTEISEGLTVRYGASISSQVATIALRYDISRRWYIEAVSGTISSLDIFFRRDF